MDINRILADLKAQREQLDRAIEALQASGRDGRVGERRRRKHNISAAGRRRLSLMMKRRWAERRKQKASGRVTRKPVNKAVAKPVIKQDTA